jgi:hypothetical protein
MPTSVLFTLCFYSSGYISVWLEGDDVTKSCGNFSWLNFIMYYVLLCASQDNSIKYNDGDKLLEGQQRFKYRHGQKCFWAQVEPYSLGVIRSLRKANHLSPSTAELRMHGAILPLSHSFSRRGAN